MDEQKPEIPAESSDVVQQPPNPDTSMRTDAENSDAQPRSVIDTETVDSSDDQRTSDHTIQNSDCDCSTWESAQGSPITMVSNNSQESSQDQQQESQGQQQQDQPQESQGQQQQDQPQESQGQQQQQQQSQGEQQQSTSALRNSRFVVNFSSDEEATVNVRVVRRRRLRARPTYRQHVDDFPTDSSSTQTKSLEIPSSDEDVMITEECGTDRDRGLKRPKDDDDDDKEQMGKKLRKISIGDEATMDSDKK